jgi:hypothetical protein
VWWHLRQVAEYCDHRLTPPDETRAIRHLERCPRCRHAVTDFHFAARMMQQLTLTAPPETLWASIDAAIPPSSQEHRREAAIRDRGIPIGGIPQPSGDPHTGYHPRLALAALIALVAVGAGYLYFARPGAAAWQLTQIDRNGVPLTPATTAALGVGKTLETDVASRFRLSVGTIGTVDVEPNTRVRLLAAGPREQRLTLERGEITATISAPPRLFFVNTPSSTVVDLGCQYTMQVDEGGLGSLRVTVGWASLEWGGRESLVPAGASCMTRPRVGPGTPSFDDATLLLKDALAAFDFDHAGTRALDLVLAESRVRDTLTLWHLLARVDEKERPRVFDRMVALTPLPDGVAREKALRLDPATLERWREDLAWTW